jgi:hypothetical protein
MSALQRLAMVSMCAFATLIADAGFAQEEAAKPGLKLVWQDEFEGDSLDHCKWGIEQNQSATLQRETR